MTPESPVDPATEAVAPAFLSADASHPDFLALTAELDQTLRETYGALQDAYDRLNRLPVGLPAVIARIGGNPVACGAIKPIGNGAFEVKRVYVKPAFRGRGIARALMGELEAKARRLGGRRLVLETGAKQAAAIGLYEGLGFSRIENFGEYAGNANSRCMAKGLRVLPAPLVTERLVVRNFREADGPALHAYLSRPETYRFEPGDPVDSETAGRMARERAEGDDFFAVCPRDGVSGQTGDHGGAAFAGEGSMVGHLYFRRAEPYDFAGWELGYIFNPEYHGKGYCTEAARALIAHAFSNLGAHRVSAFCDPRNEASWRVLERLGMRREGHFRKKAFFRRGPAGEPLWHDAWAYAILDEDRQ